MRKSSKPSSELHFLKQRIEEVRENSKGPWTKRLKGEEKDAAFYSSYMRIGVEFISGIIAGIILGLAIDTFFEIAPWGIMIGFILGSGAGFLNIYRFGKGKLWVK